MTASRKLLLSTVVGSIVTGAYWIAFFYLAYALTAGDYRPGTEPDAAARWATTIAVWTGGFALYALLAAAWRRIDFCLAAGPR